MLRLLVQQLIWLTPVRVKSVLMTLGAGTLLRGVYGKYDAELLFQRRWVAEFEANKSKVLEYWNRYRCLDEVKSICNTSHDTTILDVGCGISTVLHWLEGRRFGIDPLAHEYSRLYHYPAGVRVTTAVAEDLPFTTESFDVVFCTNVLDHVTDQDKAMDEMFRVLAQRGHFVLTVEIFNQRRRRDAAHPHSLTKQGVYSLLSGRFDIVLEKESPWIGLRAYVSGSKTSTRNEIIIVSEKG